MREKLRKWLGIDDLLIQVAKSFVVHDKEIDDLKVRMTMLEEKKVTKDARKVPAKPQFEPWQVTKRRIEKENANGTRQVG